jgi:hypothetical protein
MENILTEIESKIITAINKVSEVHEGGEEYFTALDKYIREEMSADVLVGLTTVLKSKFNFNPEVDGIILSGKFGKTFSDIINSENLNIPYLLFKGGVRKGGGVVPIDFTVTNQTNFVFLDDTIYGGKTYYTIRDFVINHGNTVQGAVVVYDGCPIKKEYVTGLYRYYDNFPDKKPNKEF